MQQYFLMIRNKVRVKIDSQLCKVNPDGQVWVYSWKDPNVQAEKVDNYVKALFVIL